MKLVIGQSGGLPSNVLTFLEGKLLTKAPAPEAVSEDAVEEYTGAVVDLTGGVGWPADGLTEEGTSQKKLSYDNPDYLATGTVTGSDFTGGTGWVGSATIN